jgi:hypothetical protein
MDGIEGDTYKSRYRIRRINKTWNNMKLKYQCV